MAKTDGLKEAAALVARDREDTILLDIEGRPALEQSPVEIQRQVHRYAVAAMPELFRKSMVLIRTSKNEKTVVEAMKFVQSLAQGRISDKAVKSIAAKLTDGEIEKELEGELLDDE